MGAPLLVHFTAGESGVWWLPAVLPVIGKTIDAAR